MRIWQALGCMQQSSSKSTLSTSDALPPLNPPVLRTPMTLPDLSASLLAEAQEPLATPPVGGLGKGTSMRGPRRGKGTVPLCPALEGSPTALLAHVGVRLRGLQGMVRAQPSAHAA